jgi:hypothetical protein
MFSPLENRPEKFTTIYTREGGVQFLCVNDRKSDEQNFYQKKTKKLNSVAFIPQANYTDRATASYWRR